MKDLAEITYFLDAMKSTPEPPDGPRYICQECGLKHGKGRRKQFAISTFHRGVCEICMVEKDVTEVRDFGYLKAEFYEKK